MKHKFGNKSTLTASYLGNTTQAILNNFIPLLFLTLQKEYEISLSMLGALVTVNFVIQLVVDAISSKVVDKLGYRFCLSAAHFLAATGLILLGILPNLLPSPYVGLVIAVVVYAIGGGLIEVLTSPVVEACPMKNKKRQMAVLHSFYCWGQMATVLLSTLFFALVGIQNWIYLSFIWAMIPLFNAFLFFFVPIGTLVTDGAPMKIRELFKTKVFWVFAVLMLASGAAELTISQWSSAFAESGLQVSKAVGDLFGPCLFAFFMGIARLLYSVFSEKINIKTALCASAVLCIGAYLLTVFAPIPALSLVGCGIAGFSVGIMWPGVLSYASLKCPKGGTALFALLALSGDVGCSIGPTIVGAVADALGGNIALGIACGIVFPCLFLVAMLFLRKSKKKGIPFSDGVELAP